MLLQSTLCHSYPCDCQQNTTNQLPPSSTSIQSRASVACEHSSRVQRAKETQRFSASHSRRNDNGEGRLVQQSCHHDPDVSEETLSRDVNEPRMQSSLSGAFSYDSGLHSRSQAREGGHSDHYSCNGLSSH